MGSKAPNRMEKPVDSVQEDLSDNQQTNDPGAYFPTHEPGYEKHRNDTVKHAGRQDFSYVPGSDTGREALADTVDSRANAQPGGLGQTNFAAGAPHEQDSSRLGNPPQDYVTPKQHAAQQREQGDTPGTETGVAEGTTGYQGQQSTSRQMPSRSPLLEEPQGDAALGFGGGQHGDYSLEHQTGAVPNDPASSSSHPKAGSGQDTQSSFSGRSPQEMSQSGNQQGLNPGGHTEGGLSGGALGGAGAVGVAAGAGTRHAHTGGAGAAGTTGSAPSAAAAPISDSELVSKYSTKQELGPSKSALDEEDPAPAAGGGTAGSRGPRTGAAGTAAASGTAPTGIGRGQSSDREPLPTSKNAEGVMDTDKGAGAASAAKPGTSSSSSSSSKKKSKGCCGCSVM